VWSQTGKHIFSVPNIWYSYSRFASSVMVVPPSPVVCDGLRGALGRGKPAVGSASSFPRGLGARSMTERKECHSGEW